MAETYSERCGECGGEETLQARQGGCSLCQGTGRVVRCKDCRAAINPADGEGVCFYCDTMGETPDAELEAGQS